MWEVRIEIASANEIGIPTFNFAKARNAGWSADSVRRNATGALTTAEGLKRSPEGYTGSGRYTLPNGDVYNGHFTDGRMEGRGDYTFSNGDIYTGAFANNKFNGVGQLNKKNGTYYVGHFADGAPVPGTIGTNDPSFVQPAAPAPGRTSTAGSSTGRRYPDASDASPKCGGARLVEVRKLCGVCHGTGQSSTRVRVTGNTRDGSASVISAGCGYCTGGYNSTYRTCGLCHGTGNR